MQFRLPTTLAALALMAACAKGDNAATDSAKMAADTTHHDTAAMAPAAPAMTDASILGFLDWANMADSSGGALAASKGTSAAVKAFGKDMMTDHHKLRAKGQELAKALAVTPEPMAGDTLPASHDKAADSLKAMAKGADWDRMYIAHEVAMHQEVLKRAQAGAAATSTAQLKSAIGEAAPVVQSHLDKAMKIQGTQGAAAPAAKP
ncbi:MAG: hypothetical protein JWO05_1424 [Gemmatimonadetes bacterium]|nr:hypothetical protein [Gemmatimonadota bacterium]